MTHSELLENIEETLLIETTNDAMSFDEPSFNPQAWKTLLDIVELHKPQKENAACSHCGHGSPCETMELIQKGLS